MGLNTYFNKKKNFLEVLLFVFYNPSKLVSRLCRTLYILYEYAVK